MLLREIALGKRVIDLVGVVFPKTYGHQVLTGADEWETSWWGGMFVEMYKYLSEL